MDPHEFAKNELDILCPPEKKDSMQRMMDKDVLDIIDMFSNQGHSGLSASYAISILERLLRKLPLTPLTGDEDEWQDITKMYGAHNGETVQQNKRCGQVFRRNNDNSTAYDMRGKIFYKEENGERYYFINRESRIPIKFPYTVPLNPEEFEYIEDLDDEEEGI
jgi:hypothetical protein